jgi:hypothetical protein
MDHLSDFDAAMAWIIVIAIFAILYGIAKVIDK